MRPDLNRLKEFLYETSYDKLDYDSALKWFESRNAFNGPVIPGCSSLMINGILGRNYDWLYDLTSEFVVKTKAISGDKHQKYDVLGVCSNVPGLDEPFVESGKDSEAYTVLPFYLLDGVNSAGMTVSMNVVPTDKGDNKIIQCKGEEYGRICSIMLPRWILDHYATPEEAYKDIMEHYTIYHPDGLINMGYNIHLLLKNQENRIWIVEFDNNRINVKDITDKPFMTNFHLIGTQPNEDGTYYGPADVPEHIPTKENMITEHSQGVERYNLIVSMLNSNTPILECMKQLLYTRLYQSSKNPSNPIWYSEFTADGLSVDMPYQAFETIVEQASGLYTRRERNGDTSQTVHTALYDTNSTTAYTLQLWTQEDLDSAPFTFDLKLKCQPKKGCTLTYTRPPRNFHNYLNNQGAHVLYFECLSTEHTDTWPNKTPDGFILDVGSKLYETDNNVWLDWQGDRWKKRDGDTPGPTPSEQIAIRWEAIYGLINGTESGIKKYDLNDEIVLNYSIGSHKFSYLPSTEKEAREHIIIYKNGEELNPEEFNVNIKDQTISFYADNASDEYNVGFIGADFVKFSLNGNDYPRIAVEDQSNIEVYSSNPYRILLIVSHNLEEVKSFKITSLIRDYTIKDIDWPKEIADGSFSDDTISFKCNKNLLFKPIQVNMNDIPVDTKIVLSNDELRFVRNDLAYQNAENIWYPEDLPTGEPELESWPWYEKKYSVVIFEESAKDTIKLKTCVDMFTGSQAEKFDLSNMDVSEVNNFKSMFSSCENARYINLENWQIKQQDVVLHSMFIGTKSLEELIFPKWNDFGATYGTAQYMFWESGIHNPSSYDLAFLSTATNAKMMFVRCPNITELDLRNPDYNLLEHCTTVQAFLELTNITKFYFDKLPYSSLTNVCEFFFGCEKLEKIYIPNRDINFTGIEGMYMFRNCFALTGESTVFDRHNIDEEYARWDNPPEAPGYFTYLASAVGKRNE